MEEKQERSVVSAQMRAVGLDSIGRQLYWAEPGRFANPGLYVWKDGENVRVFSADVGAEPATVEGLPVPGYRPRNRGAVDLVSSFKHDEERLLRKLDAVRDTSRHDVNPVDHNWLYEGRRMIELGFMMINRSIFMPSRVRLPGDPPAEAATEAATTGLVDPEQFYKDH